MFQCGYDTNGKRLFKNDDPFVRQVQFWNDACWNRIVPMNTKGLTYLDIGCCNGVFMHRFEQSGGCAEGIDVHPDWTNKNESINPSLYGKPLEDYSEDYRMYRGLYGNKLKAIIGGFEGGKIIPDCGEYDYISIMNVLEYVKDPRQCVESALTKARKCLFLCTDIDYEKLTQFPNIENFAKQLWVFNIKDIMSWVSPYPNIVWTYDTITPHPCRYQIFIAVFKDPKDAAQINMSRFSTDSEFEITETYKERGGYVSR